MDFDHARNLFVHNDDDIMYMNSIKKYIYDISIWFVNYKKSILFCDKTNGN